MRVREVTAAEKARRFDAIQGAVIDFSNGRRLDDVWAEVVSLALPDEPDSNNDPEPHDSSERRRIR